MSETALGSAGGQGQFTVLTPESTRARPVPLVVAGVFTTGISDCMVVGAACRSNGQWTRFWFEHISGGRYQNVIHRITTGLQSGTTDELSVGFIAAGSTGGTDEIVAGLTGAGIQAQQIRIYISGTGNQGFHFGVNFARGLFGELTPTGGELV